MASEIKTLPLSILTKDIWQQINSLTEQNIKEGVLPYLNDQPLPQDMNMVNGSHLGDLNKIELELKASLSSSSSLEWIFGADAEIIGLELDKTKKLSDMIVSKNINRNGSVEYDAQYAYLLDDFTNESKKRLFEPDLDQIFGHLPENLQKQIKKVVQNIITNIDEYHRGERETPLIKQKKQNVKDNVSNEFLKGKIKETTQQITNNYDKNQKQVFDHLQNYYLTQITGFKTYQLNEQQKEQLLQSFKELSVVDTPRLTETLTNSYLLAERKTHYEFEKEQIYSQDDKTKDIKVQTPQTSNNITVENEQKSKDKLRDRDRTLRPQHTRGVR